MQQLEKYTVFLKSCCNLKKFLFALKAKAESAACSLFFEKYSKTFLQFDSQKTLSRKLKIYRNICWKKLSAIIYQLPISLKKIEIYYYRYRLRFFEIIGYCYRFTAAGFIVPITDSGYGSAICMLQRLSILLRLRFSTILCLRLSKLCVEINNNKNIAEAQYITFCFGLPINLCMIRGAERNFGPRGKNFVWALWSVVLQNHVMSKKKVIASADLWISAQNQVMSKKWFTASADVQVLAQHLVMSKIRS